MLAAAAAIVFTLADVDGTRHGSADFAAARATVIAFIAPECPISNAYAPELARLWADYAPRGVQFFAAHSDPSVTVAAARRHAQAYRIPFPVLLDPKQSLARQAGVTRTLEVAVVGPAGRVLYRGRVDDRNAGYGVARPHATRQDLRAALDEILAGRPVSVPETKALGCAIPFARAPANDGPTFAREIAPVIYRECVQCHRPGESAPFPLLTYADVARRADLIAAVTASRYMPPWLPAAGYGQFQHERRLTAAEIAMLARWAGAGAPEGDRSRTPAPPPPVAAALGPAGLTAEMRSPYAVPADGPDQYRCFLLPAAIDRDRYVRALDISPGNRKLAHHALLFADLTGTARKRDRGDGYECFGSPGFLPARGLGGWTPGSPPIRMPEGIPEVLYKNADLVLQVHYHPTGKPETDRTRVALYFTDRAPARRLMDIALGSTAIDIPPGERNYKVTDRFTLPVDADALGVIPHAHYVCRGMKAWAALPDGTRRQLLRIDRWNFDWQDQYRYRAPVHLPAGTRIEMEFTYDNSAGNPRNPHQPPERVVWGPGSSDEMAGLHLQVVATDPEDAEELGQALWGKMMRALGGGVYTVPAGRGGHVQQPQ